MYIGPYCRGTKYGSSMYASTNLFFSDPTPQISNLLLHQWLLSQRINRINTEPPSPLPSYYHDAHSRWRFLATSFSVKHLTACTWNVAEKFYMRLRSSANICTCVCASAYRKFSVRTHPDAFCVQGIRLHSSWHSWCVVVSSSCRICSSTNTFTSLVNLESLPEPDHQPINPIPIYFARNLVMSLRLPPFHPFSQPGNGLALVEKN